VKFKLERRDRTALVLLAGALGLWVFIEQAVFPFYDELRAAPAVAKEREELLSKYQRQVARKDSQAQTVKGISGDNSQLENLAIRADNPSLAAVDLQSMIEQAAALSNISIGLKSVSAVKAKTALLNEVGMSLNFDCVPGQLVSFLSVLRNSPKILNVRTLQITPMDMAYEPPKRGELAKKVRIVMTVTAAVAVNSAQGNKK
jgi:Type II secretion system (T2SS), protein M subtype b